MGGPPLALTVAAQGWPVRDARAVLVAFNLLSALAALPLASAAGLVRPVDLVIAIVLVPFAVGGVAVGSAAARQLGAGAFRHAVLSAVLVTSAVTLVTAIVSR